MLLSTCLPPMVIPDCEFLRCSAGLQQRVWGGTGSPCRETALTDLKQGLCASGAAVPALCLCYAKLWGWCSE